MLLTIHNLPIHMQYSDVKELIISKCGLDEVIVDNLQNEGNGKRVTVGVSEEEDAALLVRKINGLFFGGQQLYVENKRQKKDSEQPYRLDMTQPQFMQQAQPAFDYSQVQLMGMWPTGMNYMYPAQPAAQAVQGAFMAYEQQQYSDKTMSQCTRSPNELDKRRGQQDYKEAQRENLFARREKSPVRGRKESRWDERYSKKDNRRRPASPSLVTWQQNSQSEPKRPKWDSRDDRPDRSDQRGRQRVDRRPSPSYNSRFDKREIYSNQRREPPHGGQRPEFQDRRGSPPRFQRDRVDPNWNTREPQPAKFNQGYSVPYQGSAKYGKFDQGPSIRGQGPTEYNFDQGSSRAGHSPVQYDQYNQGSRVGGGPVKYKKFDQGSSKAGNGSIQYDTVNQTSVPGSTQSNNFNQSPSMPRQDSAQYNKLNQSSFVPGQVSSQNNKFTHGLHMSTQGSTNYNFTQVPLTPGQGSAKFNKYKGTTVADQNKTKYNMYTEGSATADQGSTKYNKVKAKETIMVQIVNNSNAKNILNGPSVFKNLLKKVCSARIDDIVGTEELNYEDIIQRYRATYPAENDFALYTDIQKKISGGDTMTFKELWECANQFVAGNRRPRNFPPHAPAPEKSPDRAGTQTVPRPIGPFASMNKYEQCVGRLASHVIGDIYKNLNLDTQVTANNRVRVLMRKGVFARVSDIVLKMTSPPAHILPHYRKRYPKHTDAELYAKIMEKMSGKVTLTAQDIKEFGESCVGPPKVTKSERKAVLAKERSKTAFIPPGKIPAYVQGDKQLYKELKQEHQKKLKTLERFQMNVTFEKALDEEIEAIGALMKALLNNPRNEAEKKVFSEINRENLLKDCKKLIGHHVSKRVTNSGVKLVRIYGHPRPPKRAELESFLYNSQYNCLSVKKSVKDTFYTASFDSYDTIDHLCSLPPVDIGNDLSIKFKPMHVAPKTNFNQRNNKSIRKKYILSLIDESRVNMLDKDWPAQEAAENKDRAENAKKLDDTDDVILIENDIDFTVDITIDEPTDVKKAENDKVVGNKDNNNPTVEHEFLNEDFKIIDEVRGSDNDDGPKEGNNKDDDNEIGDDWDQVGDDWDQTGDDWDQTGDNWENPSKDDENFVTAKDKTMGDDNATKGDENPTEEEEDIGDEIGDNVEGIDIADVDWDDVDENDLEDY